MSHEHYEFIVAGSGAGGATIAYELAKREKSVLIIEKGRYEQPIGGTANSRRYIDTIQSIEGIRIMRAIMAGGTTVISAGCSLRCLENELASLGINLENEFREAEYEMGVAPLPPSLMSNRSSALQKAALKTCHNLEPMPKCIITEECDKCGACMKGCPKGAKWTALNYLDKAIKYGADVMYSAAVIEVLHEKGSVTEVVVDENNCKSSIKSKNVILSAGALESPVILQNSGIRAGKKLSVDLLKHVYGFVQNTNFSNELPMPLVDMSFLPGTGFILSPNVNYSAVKKHIEKEGLDSLVSPNNVLGLMIKIKDESTGAVHPDGSVSKGVSERDFRIFDFATGIAKDILIAAGADRALLFDTPINGAHPACSAAINDVVDINLQTEIEGLYVCDASVLPTAPGLPTILTIVALAKRLGKMLSR